MSPAKLTRKRAAALGLPRPAPREGRTPREPDLADLLAAQVRLAGLPAPSREHRFCARRWRVDLFWDAKPRAVCLEVDGGTWSGGRHVRGKGYEQDCVKLCEAALMGFLVLRVTGDMVRDGRALALVRRALGRA